VATNASITLAQRWDSSTEIISRQNTSFTISTSGLGIPAVATLGWWTAAFVSLLTAPIIKPISTCRLELARKSSWRMSNAKRLRPKYLKNHSLRAIVRRLGPINRMLALDFSKIYSALPGLERSLESRLIKTHRDPFLASVKIKTSTNAKSESLRPKLKLTSLEALAEAAECLKALAHPHRLRMIQMLLRDRYTVGELAKACEIPSHMASEHLRLMQRCGFLASEKDGRKVFYQVSQPMLSNIMDCIEHRFAAK